MDMLIYIILLKAANMVTLLAITYLQDTTFASKIIDKNIPTNRKAVK